MPESRRPARKLPTSVSRVAGAVRRRLTPDPAVAPTPVAATPPRPAAKADPAKVVARYLTRRPVQEWPRPVRRAVASGFEQLWQPVQQPAKEPPPYVRDVIRDQFHRLYYHVSRKTWKDTWYRGIQTYKCPTDMWVYQELIDDLRPGLVIETGTYRGGSALFIADRLDLAGRGRVVTIDIDRQPDRPQHPRLTYLTGSSVDEGILAQVREMIVPGQPVLVILDSDHSQAHVAAELKAYAPLVSPGSYLIVEDTNVNGHPAAPDHGPGPYEALEEFLASGPEFDVDPRGERYYLTQNPMGYLRRRGGEPLRRRAGSGARKAPVPVEERARQVVDELSFDGEQPQVVLLLNDFAPGGFYAGIRTAVLAAGRLAEDLGRPLRCLVLRGPGRDAEAGRTALQALLREEGLDRVAEDLRVSLPGARDVDGHHADDVWMATYWTTAHAVTHLVRGGRASADRVVHLVQDFEPGFHAWGHQHALALAAYEQDFHWLVNSRSLADHLQLQTGREVDPAAVFAPEVDVKALHAAAARWQPPAEGEVRVLFYARPDKPRNLYETGLAALRTWVERLPEDVTAVVRFAGGVVDDAVDLGPKARVELLGKVDYDAYYDLLADTDLGLALMLSPHPGHLALELPVAGIPTVTNSFGTHRKAWVEGLVVTTSEAAAIADGLEQARLLGIGRTAHRPAQVQVDLGGTMRDAVAHIAGRVRGD